MSFLKPKRATIPTQAPAATPTKLAEDVLQKDRDRRRAMLARAGRAGTILTEGLTLGSASLLGENR